MTRAPGARPTWLEWLCLGLALAGTFRYEWLLDDAFVYFRYVDNFLFLDLGLVYNHGERVEGFSSPAWLGVLTALRALHLGYWLAIRVAAALAVAVFWWLLVRIDRELAPRGGTLNLPLLYLSVNYAVLCYFTSGMETPLVQVTAALAAFAILRPDSRLAQVGLALAPLVRQELALPLVLLVLWLSWRRGFPRLLAAASALATGGWELFRIGYYADLFPNTFHLKNVPLPRQGLVFLHDALGAYHAYEVALAVAVGLILLWRRVDDRRALRLEERGVMLALAASVTIYVVAIGGDPRHYRYLAFPFCLAACSTGGVLERLARTFRPRVESWAPVCALGLLLLFGSFYPAQLDRHPIGGRSKHTRIALINDATKHRTMARLEPARWVDRTAIEKQSAYRRAQPVFSYRKTRAELWCVRGYRAFDERIVHSLGLTDAYLARTAMPALRPAHKMGLVPMAEDLVRMHESAAGAGRGAFRRHVESGVAPEWIVRNLDTLEVVERKVHNDGDFLENLRLAFAFPGKVVPYGRPPVLDEPDEEGEDEGSNDPRAGRRTSSNSVAT
jgi:hypothetical protein